jgi:hypothetical protein
VLLTRNSDHCINDVGRLRARREEHTAHKQESRVYLSYRGLPSMCGALGLIPSTARKQKQNKIGVGILISEKENFRKIRVEGN